MKNKGARIEIKVTEFKNRCLSIFDEVSRKRRRYLVTKRGKPLAEVIPVKSVGPLSEGLRGTLLKGFSVSDFATGETWTANGK